MSKKTHVILGIHITNRVKHAGDVQKALTATTQTATEAGTRVEQIVVRRDGRQFGAFEWRAEPALREGAVGTAQALAGVQEPGLSP